MLGQSAFHDITGYSFEEVDQNGWERIIHPDDYELAAKRSERLFAGQVAVIQQNTQSQIPATDVALLNLDVLTFLLFLVSPLLTMRLLYLPYDAVSVLAGNLRIPFWKFALATATGNIGGTFAFVGLGASIEGDLASGQLSLNPGVLVFSLLVLVASLALSRYLNRKENPEEAVTGTPVQES